MQIRSLFLKWDNSEQGGKTPISVVELQRLQKFFEIQFLLQNWPYAP